MPAAAANSQLPAAGASSKAYAEGSCVNTYGARLPGERAFITGRPTSRVNAPPGGRATVELGGHYGEGGRAGLAGLVDAKRVQAAPLQAVAGLAAGVRVARDGPEARPQLPGARDALTTTQAARAAAPSARAAAPARNTAHLQSSIVLG